MPVHDIIDNRNERLFDQALEDIRLSKKADQRRRAGETAENLQDAIALTDQPDERESL